MAYYQCIDCKYYEENDLNRYGEGYCTERCHYYPKSDKACNRFERRSDYQGRSNCFLTTAICNIFGFEDNCIGLETLRYLRDNYLVNNQKYYSLLAEYEVIGPIISNKMQNDEHKLEVAEYYFENYLYNIITNLIPNNRYEEAINNYVNMTNDLKRMYKINEKISREDVDNISNMIKEGNYKVKRKAK